MSKKASGKSAKGSMKKKAARKADKKARKQGLIALPPPEPLDLPVTADHSPAHQHLAQARARWEHGDWTSLLALDPARIAEDPDRARLALILAAAHSHAGDMARARDLARQAMLWGASRSIAARVLLSAAQNSLARAAAALEEDPMPHFEAAIRLVQPHADIPLLARSRRVRELARMGLLPEAAAVLEAELGLIRAAPVAPPAETLADLQAQMTDLRERLASYNPSSRQGKTRKPTFVIAGVPRSGSTWLYNATRLLIESGGQKVYARWHEDYFPRLDDDADMHVVKVHGPEQLSFPYDLILTTNRDIIDRLASLIRMGWMKQDEAAVRNGINGHEKLYAFWNQRSDLEVDFEMICNQPERAIQRIADVLGVSCNPAIAAKITEQIDALEQPGKGEKPNLVTQLHPGHHSDGQQTRQIADWIRSIL